MGNTTNRSVKKDCSPKTKENREAQKKEEETQHESSRKNYYSSQVMMICTKINLFAY